MQIRLRASALAVIVLTASACDDLLTEVPSDFVAPENFYRNAGDAIAAVNAAYAAFINVPAPLSSSDYVGRNFWMVAEYPTEVVTSRLSATNERSMVDNYHTQFTSSHPYLETIWAAAYAGINRTNAVIGRVPDVPMDAARRDQIVAEAKFLRSLHYYWLAGLFGGVPLKLEETTSIEGGTLPRATASETWTQIAQDLTEAAAVLPPSWPAGDYGRATKGAALTLLGKVYLHGAATVPELGANYQKALDAFRQVAALGYSLDPDYASLFTGANERSREIIFSLQNVRIAGLGGRITEWFAPRTTPEVYVPGAQNQFQAERPFYDSYDPRDVRKGGTWLTSFTRTDGKTVAWTWTSGIHTASNYGSTGPVPRKYLELTAPDDGVQEPDYVILRYADVLLSMAEAINEISGPTGEAYGLIDEVRRRAGLDPLTRGLDRAAFKDALFVERRFELALEMHGTFDSRRHWEWAKGRVAAHMAQIGALNTSPFTSSVAKFNAAPIPDKWKLYPLPARAIDLNPQLLGAQNPGW